MGLLIFPPLLEWIMTSLSSIVLAICLVLGHVVPAIAEDQDQDPSGNLRNPKLFYVSTSTTTSTQKSLTFCFQRITASFALQRCTGRRKRRDIEAIISASEEFDLEGADRIQPTPKVAVQNTLDENLDELEGNGEREVRYMNYWMTTTTTLTSISYTATGTFASIICSPTGFTHVTCPSG